MDTPPENQDRTFRPQVVEPGSCEEEELVKQCEPRPVVVRRYQVGDRVLKNSSNMLGCNNIMNVEEVLARSGLNVGLHRPNYLLPLSDYIRQPELPMGCKVPKFTKFVG